MNPTSAPNLQRPIVIATRESRLAMWQAEHVKAILQSLGHTVQLLGMTTQGDQILDRSLSKVGGKGPKGRILHEDVQNFVKSVMTSAVASSLAAPTAGGASLGGGIDLLPWPKVDFAKFGPIESKPLSKIKKISGANLHRNWVVIPHVTFNDECDITELLTI